MFFLFQDGILEILVFVIIDVVVFVVAVTIDVVFKISPAVVISVFNFLVVERLVANNKFN